MAIAAIIPMIAITINNSSTVNPLFRLTSDLATSLSGKVNTIGYI